MPVNTLIIIALYALVYFDCLIKWRWGGGRKYIYYKENSLNLPLILSICSTGKTTFRYYFVLSKRFLSMFDKVKGFHINSSYLYSAFLYLTFNLGSPFKKALIIFSKNSRYSKFRTRHEKSETLTIGFNYHLYQRTLREDENIIL